jgi:ATP-dependent Clp protease protease subunit
MEDEDDREAVCKFTPTIFIKGEFNEEMVRNFRRAVNNIKYERELELAIIDINSPGGSVLALFEILGIMKQSGLKYITYCSGQAASCAAVLLSAGEPSQRWISPMGSVMIHGVSSFLGYAPFEEHAAESDFTTRLNTKLMQLLAKNCKVTHKGLMKKIKDSGARSLWLLAEESLDLHIVDNIGYPVVTKGNQYVVNNAM